MSSSVRDTYDRIVAEVVSTSDCTIAKMFGMPCITNEAGKAFAGFYEEAMVFKLAGPEHAGALALDGAHRFDPSGRGRPMKEWVVVPAGHADRWLDLAWAAHRYSRLRKG